MLEDEGRDGTIMKAITYLRNLTGANWTAIKFWQQPQGKLCRQDRLCVAVSCSFKRKLLLNCASLTCPGALYVLGCLRHKNKLAGKIARDSGMPIKNVRQLIAATPRLKASGRYLEMGRRLQNPDLFISNLSPEAAMKLLRQWQMVTGTRLETALSTFMAVCSSVVAVLQNRQLLFSLGCPDSRTYGKIGKNRLLAVLPKEIVVKLMRKGSNHANL